MANEIRDLKNRIPKLKNDYKVDWIDTGTKADWKLDFGSDLASIPVNTVAPVIAGYTTNPAVGNNLTCPTGTWTGSGIVYTYEWRQTVGTGASATKILSTTNTYTVPAGAAGRQWTCKVTATNTAGKVSVTTAATPVSV